MQQAPRPDPGHAGGGAVRRPVRGSGLPAAVRSPAAGSGGLEAVISYPSVGAWALHTLRGDQEGPGAVPGRLSAVAAAAAIRAGLPAQIEVPVTGGRVVLPALGAAAANGHTALVRTSPPEVCSARPAGGGGPGRPRLARAARDPGRLAPRSRRRPRPVPDARRPGSRPAPVRGARRTSWTRAIQHGWHLLASDHRAVAAEVAAALSVIVPLSPSGHGQLSSSSPETFRAIAMSRPPDPHTCAVTFSHEVQHLKLGALLHIVSLTRPDDGRRYYAPWRADPRPVAGLLQGAYAYLGVTGFWRTQRRLADGPAQLRADGEFALWRAGTARVIDTLLSSQRAHGGWPGFRSAHVQDGRRLAERTGSGPGARVRAP